MHNKNSNWKTVPIIWIGILVILLGRSADAGEPMSPEDYCWQQQAAFIDEGVEMATGPITTGGERWHIVWSDGDEDLVPGSRITIPFADGDIVLRGTTATMADNLMTLNRHWKAGREPFAVRFEGIVYLIVPYWENETQEAWCDALPLRQ
jgi:hypothetical protein